MKKYIFLCLITLILSSCFGGDDVAEQTGLIIQENEDFSIFLPSTWNEVSDNDLVTPKSGEVVLAFRSNEARQGYINNIVILKKENTSISAQAIIESGVQSLESGIKGYELISNNQVTFIDEVAGNIITYSGRYSDSTPETVYVQAARVCGDNSFYLTISLTERLESYERYEYILQNFECS